MKTVLLVRLCGVALLFFVGIDASSFVRPIKEAVHRSRDSDIRSTGQSSSNLGRNTISFRNLLLSGGAIGIGFFAFLKRRRFTFKNQRRRDQSAIRNGSKALRLARNFSLLALALLGSALIALTGIGGGNNLGPAAIAYTFSLLAGLLLVTAFVLFIVGKRNQRRGN